MSQGPYWEEYPHRKIDMSHHMTVQRMIWYVLSVYDSNVYVLNT